MEGKGTEVAGEKGTEGMRRKMKEERGRGERERGKERRRGERG